RPPGLAGREGRGEPRDPGLAVAVGDQGALEAGEAEPDGGAEAAGRGRVRVELLPLVPGAVAVSVAVDDAARRELEEVDGEVALRRRLRVGEGHLHLLELGLLERREVEPAVHVAARLDEVLRLHLEPALGDARSDGRERDEGLEELLDAVAVEVAEDGDDARGL